MSKESVDIQPETTANIQEPIVKTGGESFTSFDELENVSNYKARQNELNSEKEGGQNGKEKSNEKSNEKNGKKELLKENSKLDAKKSKDLETNKPESLDKKQTEPNDKVLPQIKTIKLKNGDDEIQLRHDTKIPVKIDGKIEDVPVEELVKNYSGTKAVDERFKQYSQERYKFDQDRKEVDSFISDVFEASKTDPIKGLIIAAERMGLDPVQYQMHLMDALSERANQWSQMSEQDRALYKYQQENAQLKSQHEKIQSRQMLDKQTKELDSQVNELQTKLGVSREEFAKSYFTLETLQKSGQLKKDITPELVADYISDTKKVASAREILNDIDSGLAENKEALDSIVEVMYDYPKLGIEDIKSIAKDYYGKVKPSQKITEKLAKGKPDLVEPKRKINAGQDLTSFEELDRLFR